MLTHCALAVPLALLSTVACTRAPAVAHAAPLVDAPVVDTGARVILVTLDGARWQDVMATDGALFPDEPPLMPTLLARAKRDGVLVRAETSSPAPVSLPGYMTLLVGPTSCADNACPRTTTPSVPERIARALSLPAEQVALFSSWSKVARAFASTNADAGAAIVHVDAPRDGPAGSMGAEAPPWDNARYDDVTARKALAHLEAHRPRFLHIALLDMDEHAHARNARATADALKAADALLARALALVDSWPAEERAKTTVVVTADHGRGPGPLWFDHRAALPASREIFVAVLGARAPRAVSGPVTQHDVRRAIEVLFGLAPGAAPPPLLVDDAR